MKKIFLICWIIIFLFVLFTVFSGKVKEMGRVFIHEEGYFGDLYNECKLEDFKFPINILEVKDHTPFEDAEIICYGDSFFFSTLDSCTFAKELEYKAGMPVYFTTESGRFQSGGSPLSFLRNIGCQKGGHRIMILEAVERYSLEYSDDYLKTGYSREITCLKEVKEAVFENKDIEFFFRENIIIQPIHKLIKNARYTLFGEVDAKIWPVSKEHEFLFFREGTEFNERKKSRQEILKLCNIVARLSKILKEDYNITLIYVIIPNKYTIYGDYAGSTFEYDNYIPSVCTALREVDVHVIDLFSIYKQYRSSHKQELLYYPGDTHYTPLGKSLLVKAAAVEIIRIKEKSEK